MTYAWDAEQRRCPVCNMRMWPAGIPRPMRFHDVRHTTATLLLKACVPIQHVQRILRHANVRTTVDTYGHLANEDLRAPLELLPKLTKKSLPKSDESRHVPNVCQPLRRPKSKGPAPTIARRNPGPFHWSGTPDSNWRPSPWQAVPEPLQADAESVKPAESLADQQPVERAVLSVDATKCCPTTDTGLTPIRTGLLESISDDRLFTVAQVAELLQVRKTDVYAACDKGQLAYVRFEGAVQIEGRDLKSWALIAHQSC